MFSSSRRSRYAISDGQQLQEHMLFEPDAIRLPPLPHVAVKSDARKTLITPSETHSTAGQLALTSCTILTCFAQAQHAHLFRATVCLVRNLRSGSSKALMPRQGSTDGLVIKPVDDMASIASTSPTNSEATNNGRRRSARSPKNSEHTTKQLVVGKGVVLSAEVAEADIVFIEVRSRAYATHMFIVQLASVECVLTCALNIPDARCSSCSSSSRCRQITEPARALDKSLPYAAADSSCPTMALAMALSL
eukprot:14668-Heterococcus_DN1.PRE.1